MLLLGIPDSIFVFSGGTMSDLVFLGLTLLFFAVTFGLVVACERLMEEKP
jgi:hypothetical protein